MTQSELFSCISSLRLDQPSTWENRLFLTFDLDWAQDDVLLDTIELVERSDVAATWFVTHDSPLLERLRANPKFELGIHPNFNLLLARQAESGATAEEVVDRLLELVPEAKAVRSHSTTQSSPLLQLFADKGLTHDCNHLIPEQANIRLKPWRNWTGLVKVPYFWEDDVVWLSDTNTPIERLAQRPGLRVFNFHPVHVYLNTEDLSRYEQARPSLGNPAELIGFRNRNGRGTRTMLEGLLGLE